MTPAILKDLSAQYILGPVSLQGKVTIGRSSSCQIRYPMHLQIVSRQHARVFPVGGYWAIEDLGSRNGTFVNEQPVQGQMLLEPNSTIQLGWEGPELHFTTEALGRLGLPQHSPQTAPLSHTVLFPLFSVRKDVWESGYLLPVSITAICGALIALANHTQNVSLAQLTFSLLTCTLGCLGFYELCNRRKPWQFTLLVMLMMAVGAYGFRFLARSLCSEQTLWCSDAFRTIVGEECFKSIPILVCLFLGEWFPRWQQRMQIEEPLDGILIAGASATGLRLGQAISSSLGLNEFNLNLFSILLGLGPIAYSSLIGYCVGLFGPYARKLAHRHAKLALLLYGYAGAFGLRTVQYGIDSLPESGGWAVVAMGLSVGYALLCAYILYAYVLKAKKLSERLASQQLNHSDK